MRVDPLFLSISAADFRLAAFSPCIDSATNADAFCPKDLFGMHRPGMGEGTPPIVDMGAYEFQEASCAADFDRNGQVNFFVKRSATTPPARISTAMGRLILSTT